MKVLSIRKPEWNEKKIFKCKKCGKPFMGIKVFFFTKCPYCGSHKVEEDNRTIHSLAD
jgi:predicted Zn-ribbon and HTH transcriptional regulator